MPDMAFNLILMKTLEIIANTSSKRNTTRGVFVKNEINS